MTMPEEAGLPEGAAMPEGAVMPEGTASPEGTALPEGAALTKGTGLLPESATDLYSMLTVFGYQVPDLRTVSPLTLAYLGDAVYEEIVRTRLVLQGRCPVNQLHARASRMVRASAQSAVIGFLESDLTEEEFSVYRRGRNANSHTMAKNAAMSDYRRATGFEALMGYLYLKNDRKRLLELVCKGIDYLERCK